MNESTGSFTCVKKNGIVFAVYRFVGIFDAVYFNKQSFVPEITHILRKNHWLKLKHARVYQLIRGAVYVQLGDGVITECKQCDVCCKMTTTKQKVVVPQQQRSKHAERAFPC